MLNNHRNIVSLLNFSQDIPAVCAPLFQCLDIDYFDYFRVNIVNDTRIVLTSNMTWLEYYYDHMLYQHSSIAARTLYFHEQRQRYLLWSDLQDVSPFRELKDVAQLYHGISLIYANAKESHVYSFGSKKDKQKNNAFFLSNIDVFNRFINYFNEKSCALIKQAESRSLFIPKHEIMSPEQLIIYQQASCKKAQLMKDTPSKRFYLTSGGDYLTQKEARCIFLTLQGYRAKNVADMLHISQKTVESHLNTAKDKFHCHSVRELFQKIMDSPFYQLFHLFADPGCNMTDVGTLNRTGVVA